MDPAFLNKLRGQQALVIKPDGREGVPVTLQYRGSDVPKVSRPERKQWLKDRFLAVRNKLGGDEISLDAESISSTAQTVEAVCPVDQMDAFEATAQAENLRVDVMRNVQVVTSP